MTAPAELENTYDGFQLENSKDVVQYLIKQRSK